MARTKSNIFPAVIVFKTSERSNAKIKMKIYNNKCLDEILDMDIDLPGVPENAIILDVGAGEYMVKRLKERYSL
jgi:deoxyadenosine/deoxycytidine kinase